MLLEAFEILQSAGQDEETLVTDFAIYKVISILTIYIPMIISTFLLSQEYLGEKIVCFAPENFTDSQAESLNEYCWTNGYWVSEGVEMVKSLYTQPHRYYPLYLPLQVIITMSPVIFWNIMTKSQLLAVLRGTEEFLDDLHELLKDGDGDDGVVDKAINRMKQFHYTCITACRTIRLSKVVVFRLLYETCLLSLVFMAQFSLYNHQSKSYHCKIEVMHPDEILCTVPTLDLLDMVWGINVTCLLIALAINVYLIVIIHHIHNSNYQPMFFNTLPYGDTDDFNETVIWEDRWLKDSYFMLTKLFLETNAIMTRSYVLQAMKPLVQSKEEKPGKDMTPPEEDVTPQMDRKVSVFHNALDHLEPNNVDPATIGPGEQCVADDSSSICSAMTASDLDTDEKAADVVITKPVTSHETTATDTIMNENGNGTVRYRLTVATRLRPLTSPASQGQGMAAIKTH